MDKTKINSKSKSIKKEDEVIVKSLELLDKGINMGGIISKKREDWHER